MAGVNVRLSGHGRPRSVSQAPYHNLTVSGLIVNSHPARQ